MAATEPPRLARWLDTALPPGAPLAAAVSGGGDSVALLHLLARWRRGRPLFVATVDHGLRPEAAAEAAAVGEAAAGLGLAHVVLRWQGWDGTGNLQDAARTARTRLIADWAVACGIGHIAIGHTRDDQAETVLMRLARGSGVDGLAGMAPVSVRGGVTWLRPLLEQSRSGLRAFLAAEGIGWADDPSNDDPRFDRVRARQALAALAPLGLTAERLAATAERMAEARAVLADAARALAAPHLAQDGADLLMPVAPLAAAPAETRHRLLAHLLQTVSGNPYRPRYAALRTLAAAVTQGLGASAGGTLHGCLLTVRDGVLRIAREPAAVAGLAEAEATAILVGPAPAERHACDICGAAGTAVTGPDGEAPATTRHWDRWHVTGPFAPGHRVTALGADAEGPLPEDRAPLPRQSLAASPAVRDGDALVAAPLAGMANGFHCAPCFTVTSVLAALVTH